MSTPYHPLNRASAAESEYKNGSRESRRQSASISKMRSIRSPVPGKDEQEQIRLVESPEPDMNPDPDKRGGGQPGGRINVDRPVINHEVLSMDPYHEQSGLTFLEYLKRKRCSPLACIYSLIPILCWLPKYKWKEDLTYDLTAGFTVAVMHIPQGMAYALLGNLPPIIGIYMAFFPVLVYSFMGTSRHVSMGTFAVICLMTGKVAAERVLQYQSGPDSSGSDENGIPISNGTALYSEVEIAAALSLCVGLLQISMGFLRLGFLSLLLSGEVVSGFTTGAAVHVLTSQFKNLLGVKEMGGRSGIFKIPLAYKDIVLNMGMITTNLTPVIISVITISSLVVYNEVFKPIVAAKIQFPLPVELVTIIVGTLVSSHWNMAVEFNLTIVDYIPTGLPPPALPPLNLVPDLLVDALTISIVAYAISISMSKIFANKYRYDLDPNQELIAQGTSNMVGGFFSCAPISASLSRSLVQELVGGRTQVAGLFSCAIILVVLLWIGPFFEALPNCVLSAIIVVALKGMFMQVFDLPKTFKTSYLNAAIWIWTFLATVVLDIEYGLGVGVMLSIVLLLWRSNKPQISVLGLLKDSDLYISRAHQKSNEIPGRKIIKYTGNLNFATVEHFVKRIERIVPCSKQKSNGQGNSERAANGKSAKAGTSSRLDSTFTDMNTEWIIMDFSSLSSVDPEALKSLYLLYKRYEKVGVRILFAGCPYSVLQVMNTGKFTTELGFSNFFPSVHDAVTHCSSNYVQEDLHY